MDKDLTQGSVMKMMLRFAAPMILGNLLQQLYNIVDTLIVSWYLGPNALAAVGSAFTLMTFLTSILLGLCMGSGVVFSMRYGQRNQKGLKESPNALAAVGSAFTLMTFLTSILLGLCMGSGVVFSMRYGQRNQKGLKESTQASFVLIATITIILNVLAFISLDYIQVFLQVNDALIWEMMRSYFAVIFTGIIATFFYNYYACYLRAIGDSLTPLIFLGLSALLNIGLDLWFVVGLKRGVAGAAEATVIAQYVSGIGLGIFALILGLSALLNIGLDLWFVVGLKRGVAGAAEATVIAQYVSGIGLGIFALIRYPQLRPNFNDKLVHWADIKEIANYSFLTCIQQSVMNLGILMVQGLVNSF